MFENVLLEKLDILTFQKALKMTFWEVINCIAKQDKMLKMWLLIFKKLKKSHKWCYLKVPIIYSCERNRNINKRKEIEGKISKTNSFIVNSVNLKHLEGYCIGTHNFLSIMVSKANYRSFIGCWLYLIEFQISVVN